MSQCLLDIRVGGKAGQLLQLPSMLLEEAANNYKDMAPSLVSLRSQFYFCTLFVADTVSYIGRGKGSALCLNHFAGAL